MNGKKNTAKKVKRSGMKGTDDLRELVIQLQNDPEAMRQAKQLTAGL